MKTFLLACVFLSLAVSVFAETIGVERFDYSDGAVAGKTGGTFWDYKNVAPAGHTGTPSAWENVTGAPTVTAGALVTNSTSAKRKYNPTEPDGQFDGTTVAKVVYYRVTFTTGATLPDFVGLSSYFFTTEQVFFGKPFGQANFGFVKGAQTVSSPIAVQPNTTYTLVTKLDYVTNTIKLFINPDLGAPEPAGDASFTFPANFNPSTAVRLASGNTGSAVTWDELGVVTTWNDFSAVVTTAADEDNGSLGGGAGVSLREAVKYSLGGPVTFDPALNGATIALTLDELPVTEGRKVTVDGSSLASTVSVSGNNVSRVFNVASGATLTLRRLNIVNGATGGNGGGISNDGTLALSQCTLANNTAAVVGGGLYSSGPVTLSQSMIIGNTAGSGGGLWFENISSISNCTVTGNRSTTFSPSTGGIVAWVGSTVTMQQCTIVQNVGRGGEGGVFVNNAGSLAVSGSIVAGNKDDSGAAIDFNGSQGRITPTLKNLIGSNKNVEDRIHSGPLVGTLAAPLDPKLSPLISFGGPTMIMHPLVGSPAIDANGTTDPGGTDQRGFPRFVDGDASGVAQLDIGAVEAGPILFVTTEVDENDGPGAGAGQSLREALGLATTPGHRVGFSPARFPRTIPLTLGQLVIPSGQVIFVDGTLPSGTVTIDAGHASRIFSVTGATLMLQRLALINGSTASGGGGILNFGGTVILNQTTLSGNSAQNNTDGGGILSSAGTVILNQSTLSGNFTSGSDGNGGGISTSNDTVILNQSTLSGNSASHNGGGIVAFSSAVTLNQSTLSNNSALGEGGGIDSNNNNTLVLNQSTLSGNSASVTGGGIETFNSAVTVNQSTLSRNFAQNGGGGIDSFPFNGTVTLRNCIVAGNTSGSGSADMRGPFTGTGANLTSGNPLLALLGDYGGPTQTMPPLPGSPALDAAAGSTFLSDQRGFPFVGMPDIGAAEFQGNADLSRYWTTDWDGDGNAFGVEYALGTDPLTGDRTSSRNLTAPAFNPMGQATLSFGRNTSATFGTVWKLYRSTDLVGWTEIYSLDANGNQIFNSANVSVTLGTNTVTVTDKMPPFSKAFYEFGAVFTP